LNLLALGVACAIALVVTIYPPLLVKVDGHVDHVRLAVLMLAMAAGFVRGVGYIPRSRWLRWFFSTPAALAWLLLAFTL
jgi:predicted membrane protein